MFDLLVSGFTNGVKTVLLVGVLSFDGGDGKSGSGVLFGGWMGVGDFFH